MSRARHAQIRSLGFLLAALCASGCGIAQRTVEERSADTGNGASGAGGTTPVGVPDGGRAAGQGGKSTTGSGGASASHGGAKSSGGDTTGGIGVELDPVPVSDAPPPACSCGEGCDTLHCPVKTWAAPSAFLMNAFVRDDRLYWMSQLELRRQELGGGAQVAVAQDLKTPSRVVVDDTSAYFVSYQGLWKLSRDTVNVSITGGASSPEQLLASLQPWKRRLTELTVDSRDVYWTAPGTDQNSARVTRTPRAGGTSVTLAKLPDDNDWPLGIAVDDTHVYFTSNAGLQRLAKAGGEVEMLERIGTQVSYDTVHPQLGIALDRQYVYFDAGSSLRRLSKLDGASEVLFEVPAGDALGGVVVDADFAYFGTRSGSTYRVGKLDGAPRLITSGESNPLVTAVNADSIFWVEQELGRVRQVAK